MSCSKEGKKRGVDYAKFKSEVTMKPEQEKSYDEITAKYSNLATQNFETAKAQETKMDRVALSIKGEELRAKQSEEISKVLDASQIDKFNHFVDANSRKRPRYNNDLLEEIKTELALSEDQFAILNDATMLSKNHLMIPTIFTTVIIIWQKNTEPNLIPKEKKR